MARLISVAFRLTSYWLAGPVTAVPRGVAEERSALPKVGVPSSYIAPRFKQLGKPKVTKPRKKARDTAMARQLWDISAELTGCDWACHPTARAEPRSGESAAGYFESKGTEL